MMSSIFGDLFDFGFKGKDSSIKNIMELAFLDWFSSEGRGHGLGGSLRNTGGEDINTLLIAAKPLKAPKNRLRGRFLEAMDSTRLKSRSRVLCRLPPALRRIERFRTRDFGPG